ncbi:MAG: hypothetical protein JGK17_04705 [Microcoleus sp. PH2017_10_PVI_O_A]|uniref:hypothetical protein n=1 Tax=unclassified Microcoleus TaxID=2642155 RepID=UPI001DCEF363|nr:MULTISPECIES: hypothetical protein [unclassified Microcoleus]MCC3404889.1 hypothetical protein [Microcoleus sp. PH2017_10_PVI_O_A]MCC3460075.1 hypothetical protein [Microcoleus sp. PH2017_11_PCY_U_A]MCC3478571.1 hypothetical protein [Microcoleus sp. PH2017_12_PCY_D_A]MCC3527835.1 hypothetical protein [Microcoleus sp. PH2017_21_RUC_O_A]MCC3539907.1 hypothetical protein [Microcoleus sp. PH2017_22_RUC_O_B]
MWQQINIVKFEGGLREKCDRHKLYHVRLDLAHLCGRYGRSTIQTLPTPELEKPSYCYLNHIPHQVVIVNAKLFSQQMAGVF